jgi:phospholipid transport system substrate-binding protein
MMLGLVWAGIGWSEPAWAGAPTDGLKKSIDELTRVLEDPAWKKPEKKQERRKLLETVIGQRFNYDLMAKHALGTEWGKHTAEERRDFVTSFRTLLTSVYIGRIESYSGEKTQYLKEVVDGDHAEVYTHMVNAQSTIPIDYKMENQSAEWRVYDVVVQGTGLVQNYREQFKRILRNESFVGLTEQLRKKAESIHAP